MGETHRPGLCVGFTPCERGEHGWISGREVGPEIRVQRN